MANVTFIQTNQFIMHCQGLKCSEWNGTTPMIGSILNELKNMKDTNEHLSLSTFLGPWGQAHENHWTSQTSIIS